MSALLVSFSLQCYICSKRAGMIQQFENTLLLSTGASSYVEIERIQSLWSGYGEIRRIGLNGAAMNTAIVKHVALPYAGAHPRGWNTSLSHQRKLRSYEVEKQWYTSYSTRCGEHCRVPKCFAVDFYQNEMLFVLEDLDAAGYLLRKSAISWDEIKSCLSWLAYFHATFMFTKPQGLWNIGTYWHLDTRPEELDVLKDKQLKRVARDIDIALNSASFFTIVHGDAKLANFCFSSNGAVAAVDFQYVGGGCGMKDVAYFIGSCLDEDDCERYENDVLDFYFFQLEKAVKSLGVAVDFCALHNEWRGLYRFAWADFHRFIKGWSPGHWKINTYSERVSQEVISQIITNK